MLKTRGENYVVKVNKVGNIITYIKISLIYADNQHKTRTMSSLIKIRLFILVLQFLIGVNCRNETTRNGKTYFLQLKNVGDGELSYKPIWTKHISGKHGKNAEEYEIIGRLIQTVSCNLIFLNKQVSVNMF